MARYVNPADKVKEVGQPLSGNNLRTLQAMAGFGNLVVGVYDRGIFRIAVVLDDREFEEFEGQYGLGLLISRSFYALPSSLIDPDGNLLA